MTAADIAALQKEIDSLKSVISTHVNLPAGSSAALHIPTFSGERSLANDLPFDEFVDRFKLIARALAWTDKQKVALFPTFLSSYALECYRELSTATQTDFNLLIPELQKKLKTPHTERLSALTFRNRKLRPDESYGTFAAELKRLARSAYPTFKPDALETMATEVFIAGLPQDIQLYILEKDPQTVDDALVLAEKAIMRQKLIQKPIEKDSTLEALQAQVNTLLAVVTGINQQNKQEIPQNARIERPANYRQGNMYSYKPPFR